MNRTRAGVLALAAVLVVGCLPGCGGGSVTERPAPDPVQHVRAPGPLPEPAADREPGGVGPRSAAAPATPPPTEPTARARPQYLTRGYRAPAGHEARARGAGQLRIPSLRIAAPVVAVGLDRGAMAIPDSPARVGWLRTTAAAGDRIGASVLSAHVSDRRDVPGVLGRLHRVRTGAAIAWTDVRGEVHRFVVTGVRRYPRARGVPARLFGVVGPHVLHLVTCTDRVRTAGGGFHYASNLVVTAREVRARTG